MKKAKTSLVLFMAMLVLMTVVFSACSAEARDLVEYDKAVGEISKDIDSVDADIDGASADQMASVLRSKVIPKFESTKQKLSELKPSTQAVKDLNVELVSVMDEYCTGFKGMADATEKSDVTGLNDATTKLEKANTDMQAFLKKFKEVCKKYDVQVEE